MRELRLRPFWGLSLAAALLSGQPLPGTELGTSRPASGGATRLETSARSAGTAPGRLPPATAAPPTMPPGPSTTAAGVGTGCRTLFQPAVVYPLGAGTPRAVAIGDVNGDGRDDVVLATWHSNNPNEFNHLQVFLQETSGALASPISYPVGNSPQSVAVGDVNGDGLRDVVVANAYDYTIGILYQNASGSLDPMISRASVSATRVRIADLNGDGRQDIVAIHSSARDEVHVFLQQQSGAIAADPEVYHVPHPAYYGLGGLLGDDDLDVGDVNGDGRVDVIVMGGGGRPGNGKSRHVGILLQRPNESLGGLVYYDLGGYEMSKGLGVGDIDGDGLSDVVVSFEDSPPGSRIATLLQDSSGALQAPVRFDSFDIPKAVEIGDLNLDGRSDVVVLHRGGMSLGVYLQQSNGTLGAEQLYPVPYARDYSPHGLAVGDVDGDGSDDLVVADDTNGLVVLRNVATAPQVATCGTAFGVGATMSVSAWNGPSGRLDWVGLYAAGAPDASPLARKYLNDSITPPAAGQSEGTVTFVLPATPGSYDVHFFPNDGFQQIAMSAPVTVQDAPILEVSRKSIPFARVTANWFRDRVITVKNVGTGTLVGNATIVNDPGGPVFSLMGATTYSLGPNQAQDFTVRFASPFVYDLFVGTLALTGGGGATVPLLGTAVAPLVNVLPTQYGRAPGETVQVALSDGPGNPRDWVGLYAASAADDNRLDWKYLNGTQSAPATGSSHATVSFTFPQAPGDYEFRFFADDSYQRLSSASQMVTDQPFLDVSPEYVSFGSVTIGASLDRQVTLKNSGGGTLSGIGSVTGLGYSLVGVSSYVLGSGQTAVLTVRTAPLSPGESGGTLFFSGGAAGFTAIGLRSTALQAAITVNATTAPPGGTVQAKVSNGPGDPQDWIGLYAPGAPDGAYLDRKYLNGTQTPTSEGSAYATVPFVLPQTGGPFQFRFFTNGFTKLATSPLMTLNDAPVLEVSPTSVTFGTVAIGSFADRQVTVRNLGGGTLTGTGTTSGTDFGIVGNAAYSLASNQSTVLTIRFTPAGAGSFAGALALTGGGGATVPLSGTGRPDTPILQVSPTSVSFGTVAVGSFADRQVVVTNVGTGTLAGGGTAGGPGFTLVGNSSYSLSANQSTALTVRFAPPVSGPFSGSLTLTGGGGSTVPLAGTGSSPGGSSVTVSATVVNPREVIQVAVSGGPGNRTDWVGLFETTGTDTDPLDGKYLNGLRTPPAVGMTSSVMTFKMPQKPGAYNLRFFANNSFQKLATSVTVTVRAPSLGVSSTIVSPGATVEVTVANGPGNPLDWLGLYRATATDRRPRDAKYLNGRRTPPATGLTSAIVTFRMPRTAGTYNFRLFANNSARKLATSVDVTVQ